MLLVSGIMLLGYPRALPGARERKRRMLESGELRPSDEKVKIGLKGMLVVVFKLITNATYMFLTLGKLVR